MSELCPTCGGSWMFSHLCPMQAGRKKSDPAIGDVNGILCQGTQERPCSGLPLPPEVEAVRTQAILWAVEWTAKQLTTPETWPLSWKRGFPGLKAQALLEAPGVDALAALDKKGTP